MAAQRVAAAKLSRRGVPKLEKAIYVAKGGFRVVPRGTYASRLPRFIVCGSHWSKGALHLPTRLTHAGATYDDLARWAAPSAARELGLALGSKSFWIANIGAAVLVNVVDYGSGSKADAGIASTGFRAAVTVDVGVGMASAGKVSLRSCMVYLCSGANW